MSDNTIQNSTQTTRSVAVKCTYSRSSLTECKYGRSATISADTKVQQRHCRVLVDCFRRFVFVKRMIKGERAMIQVFGNTVDSEFRAVNPYQRIKTSNRIVIIIFSFLVRHRPFANGNADALLVLAAVGRAVVCLRLMCVILAPFADHADKINVARVAFRDVTLLFDRARLFAFQHGAATLFPFQFHALHTEAGLVFGGGRCGLGKIKRKNIKNTFG